MVITDTMFGAILEASTIPTQAGRTRAIMHLLEQIREDALGAIKGGDACCDGFTERIAFQLPKGVK